MNRARFLALANVSILRSKAVFQGDGRLLARWHPSLVGIFVWLPSIVKHIAKALLPRWGNIFLIPSDLGMSQAAAGKECVPCNSKDIQPMSEQSANELLVQVQGWSMVSEGGKLKLHRSWKVKSFTKGLELFQLVAEVAEAEDHHPDLHLVGWNNVKIDLWTYSVGGLTEDDFMLAAKINSLNFEHLLKKHATA